jgi:hypothetical protein
MASTAEYDTPNPDTDTTEQASHRPTRLRQILGSIVAVAFFGLARTVFVVE